MFSNLLTILLTLACFISWWTNTVESGYFEGISAINIYFGGITKLFWISKMWRRTRKKLFHTTMITIWITYLICVKFLIPLVDFAFTLWIFFINQLATSMRPFTEVIIMVWIIWVFMIITAIETFLQGKDPKRERRSKDIPELRWSQINVLSWTKS